MVSTLNQKIVRTACMPLDGGSCGLLAYVNDGVLVKVEPADFPEREYRHICARGLATPKLVYHPDRLKYPQKRVGARGEGKWKRISWDEALDTIAGKLNDIKAKYGPEYVGLCLGEPKGLETHFGYRFATMFGTPNVATPGNV